MLSGRDVVAAAEEESLGVAGRDAAEFPLDYLGGGSPEPRIRHEVVYVDDAGERPLTPEESKELLNARNLRMAEIVGASRSPCPRCRRRARFHPRPLAPALFSEEGPVYFTCWTPEEREEYPLAGERLAGPGVDLVE